MTDWNPGANEIFVKAIELDSSEQRDAFIDAACVDDAQLRAHVEQMLRTYESLGSFLIEPAHDLSLGSPSLFHERQAIVLNETLPEPSQEAIGSLHTNPRRSSLKLRSSDGQTESSLDVASSELPVNRSVGRYRLEGEISRGGMGVVLKGQDIQLGRELAIKALLTKHQDAKSIVQRFYDEAQIGGQLQHPGIVPVYELGRLADGRPFFSMPLVDGQSLSAALRSRQDHQEDRARWLGVFKQICQTIAYAHQRGVIHRDLKPANVMLGSFGEVQVMDWGLAKVLDARVGHELRSSEAVQSPKSPTVSDDFHTAQGSVMGTVAYMAPEQAQGETDQLDERVDVFGLGAILCEILTGNPPYVGESGTELLQAARLGQLEPCYARLAQCECDPALIEMARDCLKYDREERLRDASMVTQRISDYLESVDSRLRQAEVQSAAESARATEAIKTADAERKRYRAIFQLAASVVFSLAVAGASMLWFSRREQRRREVNSNYVLTILDNVANLRAAAELAAPHEVIDNWKLTLTEARKASEFCATAELLPGTNDRAVMIYDEVAALSRRATDDARKAAIQSHFVSELDDIHMRRSESSDGYASFDFAATDSRYAEAFAAAGYDLLTPTVQVAAAQVRTSPIRNRLLIALDLWAQVTPAHFDRRARLIEIANLADEDVWRSTLREAIQSGDLISLLSIYSDPQSVQQSSEVLATFGTALRDHGGLNESIDLLRHAQLQDPGDFWLNIELSRSLSAAGEVEPAIGFARAAIAIKPNSAGALWDLAMLLKQRGSIDESLQVLEVMMEIVPDDFYVRMESARMLIDLGRFEDSMAQSREAIRINTTNHGGHDALAAAFHRQGQFDRAISSYREAIRVEPTATASYVALATVLRDNHDEDEVSKVIDKLLQLGDGFAVAGNVEKATDAYQQALNADPKNVIAMVNMAEILERSAKISDAQAYLENALALKPDDKTLHSALANLVAMKRLDEPKANDSKPISAADFDSQRAAARLLFVNQRYEQATSTYAALIAANTDLSSDDAVEVRWRGAFAASRASEGLGDAEPLNDQRRSQHRRQAIGWLSDVVNEFANRWESDATSSSHSIVATVVPWRTEPDLTGIRDQLVVEALPSSDQLLVADFWQRVDQLTKQASVKHYEGLRAQKPEDDVIAGQLADAIFELNAPSWTILVADSIVSNAGATFEELPDQSILVSGANVDGEVYRLQFSALSEPIAALRIEALPHVSLPLAGPGRGVHAKHETGNFVGDFKSFVERSHSEAPLTSIGYRAVWADQSHLAYPINTGGYWNLGAWEQDKGQGQPHTAIFEFDSPVSLKSDERLVIEMSFQADPPYLTNLGRFRVSTTDEPTYLERHQQADGLKRLELARAIISDKVVQQNQAP